MRRKTISELIYFMGYFALLLVIDVARTQAVRYHNSNSVSCPPNRSYCVTVTSCASALREIKKRKNPTVCGWDSEVPMVCCANDKNVTPRQLRKISGLSPKGCGRRRVAPPLDDVVPIVVHPPPSTDILPSGIEPRIGFREDIAVTERQAPTLGDSNFFSFAVGGEPSTMRWPWIVAIFNGNANRQLCGGTLIDDRHVITAAHCFVGRSLDPNLYKVQVGELFLNEANTKYDVMEIKLHEGYRARYYYDDIAIMRLTNPLSNFTTACLPAEDDVKQGDNVTVLGWGDLSWGGPSTAKLQEVVNIPIVRNSRCDAKFRTLPGAPFPRGITNTFLCAGLEEGGKDACQGDSGGPLLLEHSEGYWSLVGVVSFGYKCGEPGYPGVYTKVSSYLTWIEKFIGNQNEVATEKRARSQNFEYIDGKPIWRSVTEKVQFPT